MTHREQTERDESRNTDKTQVAHAVYLFLVMEYSRPLAGGLRCDLSQFSEVVLGRGAERSATREQLPNGVRLVIRVPDRRMSADHARLQRTVQGFVLKDLGSTNGTYLNGRVIDEASVADGSWFELGRTVFRLRERVRVPAHGVSIAPIHDSEADTTADPRVTVLPAEAAALALVFELARSPLPILLLGETGTGKEVLARQLHAASGRSGALVAVNCGAIPRELLASSLFGHRRGAFSGATADAMGFVRAADGGTLLLDEIGDLPLDSQVALLRVLQEREVVPVGDTRPIPVDIRVIAATHVPLPELVTRGEFRADLLSRLAGHVHPLPPLRKRREDIGMLVASIGSDEPSIGELQNLTLSSAAGEALLTYDWPGNVRELRQALMRAVVLSDGRPVEREHLPAPVTAGAGFQSRRLDSAPTAATSDTQRVLRGRLETALIAERGNVTRVAKAMGKQRVQIQRWLKRFGIDAARYRIEHGVKPASE